MSRSLSIVGRFWGDHHWPVLGDRRGSPLLNILRSFLHGTFRICTFLDMSFAQQIQEMVVGYINGKVSLRSLSDWISDIGWDAEESVDEAARSLFSEVELALYDHVHSSRPEQNIKAKLARLLGSPLIELELSVADKRSPKVRVVFLSGSTSQIQIRSEAVASRSVSYRAKSLANTIRVHPIQASVGS
jgi:hypothetical protein